LGYSGQEMVSAIAIALAKAAVIVLFVIVGSKHGVPTLLTWAARSNSRELFILTGISICLGVSLIARELGVSLALGAFLAGIMISERPFGHQVLSDIMPLRDLFAILFFVSIGLLLNPLFVWDNWTQVIVFCLVLVLGKALVGAIASLVTTKSLATAAITGATLAQIGEFSFVLATLGNKQGLIDDHFYQLFFAGAVVTLIISPYMIELMSKVVRSWSGKDVSATIFPSVAAFDGLSNHVILKGFGRTGRHLGLTLKELSIPFVVIELDGQKVRELEGLDMPFIYGDALNARVLEVARLETARCIVITGPDRLTNEILVREARQRNPDIMIIARAIRMEDIEVLRAGGANAVVQPELESSVEIAKLALISMSRPAHEIRESLASIRRVLSSVFRPDMEMDPFVEFPHEDYFGLWFTYLGDEDTLDSLNVRKRTGVTVLAINRSDGLHPHPDGLAQIMAGDKLYVSGNESQLYRFERSYRVELATTPDSQAVGG
ncbi:MAG: cation:proton antiporter, partial [Cyanobacteria bacterium]|nr:cation:proton antiporter [Cyanobacteriota bacterium]